jgi:hypothetical protein
MPRLFVAGRSVDATFSVGQVEPLRFHVFFESRSGTKGTPTARNTQYEEGLELLLARLFGAGVTVESIALSPGNKDSLTEISVAAIPFPWTEKTERSPHDLRVQLGRVQAGTDRKPGAHGRGNHTKRLRLACRAAEPLNRRELEVMLSGEGSDAERLTSIVAALEQRASA